MLTVKQASVTLGVSTTCVYQLVSQGRLACHRIGLGRGAIRISESDLSAFIESCRQSRQTPSEAGRPKQSKPTRFKHLRLE